MIVQLILRNLTTQRRLFGIAYETTTTTTKWGWGEKERERERRNLKNENAIRSQRSLRDVTIVVCLAEIVC